MLRTSHDRLADFVASLDGDDLARQSMATEWSVAQVLSHLGSGAEIALGGLEACISGDDAPSPESYSAIWQRWNERSAEEMATAFVSADERLVAAYEQLDSVQLTNLRLALPFLPEPIDVATAVAFRLSEHALHSWDVFASFDTATPVAADAAELLVDMLPMLVALLDRFTPRETRPADAVRLEVDTVGPTRRYQLELGDSATLVPSPSGVDGADGTLAIPSEALIRLAAGRLKPQLPLDGIELSGPMSLDDLRRAFPGY